jgi:hypothetical protein
VWPRDLTVDDLVSWGWSLALASTGIVFMYWVDVIAGAVLLVVGLAGMRAVRVRHGRRSAVMVQSPSKSAGSTRAPAPAVPTTTSAFAGEMVDRRTGR